MNLTNLKYDPETGIFSRRGKPITTLTKNGYIVIRVNQLTFLGHRLAWYISYGTWPKLIDHINRVRDDNRLNNLREVTPSESNMNRKESRPKYYPPKKGLPRKTGGRRRPWINVV